MCSLDRGEGPTVQPEGVCLEPVVEPGKAPSNDHHCSHARLTSAPVRYF